MDWNKKNNKEERNMANKKRRGSQYRIKQEEDLKRISPKSLRRNISIIDYY